MTMASRAGRRSAPARGPAAEIELVGRLVQNEDVGPRRQDRAEGRELQFAAGKLVARRSARCRALKRCSTSSTFASISAFV